MSIIKFLLDENVDPRLLKALRRRAPEMVVWPIGAPGTPALQTLDPEILIWCETKGFSWSPTIAPQCRFISKTIYWPPDTSRYLYFEPEYDNGPDCR